MSKINLDYLKDTEGNYIVKQKIGDDENLEHLTSIGDYTKILLIGKHNFNKKLKHKIEDCAQELEDSIMLQYKLYRRDIISKKITANILLEEDYNPLFESLTEEESETLTKNSTKVKVNFKFEYHIKIRPHLWCYTLIGLFKKK